MKKKAMPIVLAALDEDRGTYTLCGVAPNLTEAKSFFFFFFFFERALLTLPFLLLMVMVMVIWCSTVSSGRCLWTLPKRQSQRSTTPLMPASSSSPRTT